MANAPDVTSMKSLELLIRSQDLDPTKWLDFPDFGLRQYFFWKHPANGGSIALLEFQEGLKRSTVVTMQRKANPSQNSCLDENFFCTADVIVLIRPRQRVVGDFRSSIRLLISPALR